MISAARPRQEGTDDEVCLAIEREQDEEALVVLLIYHEDCQGYCPDPAAHAKINELLGKLGLNRRQFELEREKQVLDRLISRLHKRRQAFQDPAWIEKMLKDDN